MQLGRTGGPMRGSTNKQLTRLLMEDYNEKACRGYHIGSGQVNDLDSLKTHLQGKSTFSQFIVEMRIEPTARSSGSVRFDQPDSSVRFWFGLSNSSGSFGSVRLAKDMVSSSVRVLFDSHL